MASILFFTFQSASHVNTRLSIVDRLLSAGHRVGWFTFPGAVAALAHKPGLDLLNARHPFPRVESMLLGSSAKARSEISTTPAAEAAFIEDLYVGSVRPTVETFRAVIRDFDPDCVATDGRLYATIIASALEGRPYASLRAALILCQPPDLDYPLEQIVAGFATTRAELMSEYGVDLPFIGLDAVSPYLNVLLTPPELVAGIELPAHTVALGSSIATEQRTTPPFDWARVDASLPLIYLAFGTRFGWRPALISILLEAASSLGQVVASIGAMQESDSFVVPRADRCITEAFVDQLDVLDHTAVFITHGGASSLMEAIERGVPMLVIPLSLDQPVSAYLVERARIGIALRPEDVTVEAAGAAIRELLDPANGYRERARALMIAAKTHDGAAAVADALVALATGDRPSGSPP